MTSTRKTEAGESSDGRKENTSESDETTDKLNNIAVRFHTQSFFPPPTKFLFLTIFTPEIHTPHKPLFTSTQLSSCTLESFLFCSPSKHLILLHALPRPPYSPLPGGESSYVSFMKHFCVARFHQRGQVLHSEILPLLFHFCVTAQT